MAKRKLSFETIAELQDGERVIEDLNAAISLIANDCDARPHISKPRTIRLSVEMKPRQRGEELDIAIKARVEFKIPPHASRETIAHAKNGTAEFNPASPEDCNQGTLDGCR